MKIVSGVTPPGASVRKSRTGHSSFFMLISRILIDIFFNLLTIKTPANWQILWRGQFLLLFKRCQKSLVITCQSLRLSEMTKALLNYVKSFQSVFGHFSQDFCRRIDNRKYDICRLQTELTGSPWDLHQLPLAPHDYRQYMRR